jgi:hypothetical protein
MAQHNATIVRRLVDEVITEGKIDSGIKDTRIIMDTLGRFQKLSL